MTRGSVWISVDFQFIQQKSTRKIVLSAEYEKAIFRVDFDIMLLSAEFQTELFHSKIGFYL